MKSLGIVGRVVGGVMEAARSQFPKVVRIETTNHCNAACSFCPRESIGRKKTFMDQTLFEKVIGECVDGGCRMIHMHNFGEPLLDKRLPERIRYAKDQGIPKVKLFSNGALLHGKMAEDLLESGLDEIKISVDGSDAEEFNLIRIGLQHDQVVENVRQFMKLRKERGHGPAIVAACTTTSDERKTKDMLKGLVDGIDFARVHNWAGARNILGNFSMRKPCDRPFRTMTVLVNGDIALCCLDHSGREILGNCETETIADIWNNARYQEIRRLHRESRQDEIPLCSNCSKCFLVGSRAA
ncbi:MAG: radical SAM/SPASM domain-containing protein [Planctomycetota bacterium]|nr:radical SAM/SPASM domain-containing protein [Planctomycetota bacterium]MDA1165459.1 radical SAM/SPASM domain-containing protein [Planctomycetota bacterium]